jgi:hypothetical protein
MIEYWEKSIVKGWDADKKLDFKTEVLHRRGEDPLVMAIRRFYGMAGCQKFAVSTVEAFQIARDEDREKRRFVDVPRMGPRFEEWQW